MQLHERLRRLRGDRRQLDVAQAAGVAYSTYRDWEAGRATPPLTAAVPLADALDVDPNELTGWKDPT